MIMEQWISSNLLNLLTLLKLEKLVLFFKKKDYLSLIYGQYKEIEQKMEIIHFNKII